MKYFVVFSMFSVACIWGSIVSGLRLFIKKTSLDGLSHLVTDSKQLQAVVESIEERTAEKIQSSPAGIIPTSSSLGFREVDLSKVPGSHAVGKIEAILTCLS